MKRPESSSRIRRSAFSLVEMLVVVGIISVLAAVSLPALVGLSRASRGSNGVVTIMATLERARNLAISQATPVYLMMATGSSEWPQEYRGRAFATFTETYNPANTTAPYQQTPLTEWAFLPEGVAFQTPIAPSPLDTVHNAPLTTAYFPVTSSDLPVAVVKFDAGGGIELPEDSGYARVRIFDGFYDSRGTAIPTNRAGRTAEYSIRLVRMTGRSFREDVLGVATPTPVSK